MPKKLIQLIAVSFIVRLLIAVFIWPGADEAYYYLYTANPALSYFDHPPFVAWLGSIGILLSGSVSPFSLRFGTLLLFSLSIYIVYKLSMEFYDEKVSFNAALIYTLVPMFFFSGTMILPDAGLLFFWMLALYAFVKAVDSDHIAGWIFFGFSAGMAMLSKYTAVFLYSGAFIYLLIDKDRRKLLISPGPYIAVIISILVFSPVIIWNYMNDFISFSFQGGRIGAGGIKIRYFYQSIFGQMAYLLPFYFAASFYLLYRSLRKKEKSRVDLINISFALIPLAFFISASLFKRVLPHWPVIAYASLVPAAGSLAGTMDAGKRYYRYLRIHIAVFALVILIAFIQLYTGLFMNRALGEQQLEKRVKTGDITIDIIGWREFADYVEQNYKNRKKIFIFTNKWYLGGQIAMALKNSYPVLCFSRAKDERGFSFWEDKAAQLHKDGIFVTTSKFYKDPRKIYDEYFDSIELEKVIEIKRRAVTVKYIYLYRCRNYKKDI